VKGFLPGPDPDAQRFYSSDSLIVYVAFPLHGRDEAVRGGVRRPTPTTSFCSTGNSASLR
jgi:hypothetical protein